MNIFQRIQRRFPAIVQLDTDMLLNMLTRAIVTKIHNGILPCFRGGFWSILFLSARSERISSLRVY